MTLAVDACGGSNVSERPDLEKYDTSACCMSGGGMVRNKHKDVSDRNDLGNQTIWRTWTFRKPLIKPHINSQCVTLMCLRLGVMY